MDARVFAAGDGVTGPALITDAVGQGRRAGHMIDRFLHDLPLDGFDAPLPYRRDERRACSATKPQPQRAARRRRADGRRSVGLRRARGTDD